MDIVPFAPEKYVSACSVKGEEVYIISEKKLWLVAGSLYKETNGTPGLQSGSDTQVAGGQMMLHDDYCTTIGGEKYLVCAGEGVDGYYKSGDNIADEDATPVTLLNALIYYDNGTGTFWHPTGEWAVYESGIESRAVKYFYGANHS